MSEYPVDPVSVSKTAQEFASISPPFAPARMGEAIAIHLEVMSRIEYREAGREAGEAQHPKETLRREVGNCSDEAVLIASLCEARDIPTRIIAPVVGPPDPGGHLLPEIQLEETDVDAAAEKLQRIYDAIEYPTDEFGIEIDGEGRLWVPVDSAMAEYVGDIGHLLEHGYAKRQGNEWWWGALITDASEGRFQNNGRIVSPTDDASDDSSDPNT